MSWLIRQGSRSVTSVKQRMISHILCTLTVTCREGYWCYRSFGVDTLGGTVLGRLTGVERVCRKYINAAMTPIFVTAILQENSQAAVFLWFVSQVSTKDRRTSDRTVSGKTMLLGGPTMCIAVCTISSGMILAIRQTSDG